MDLALSQCFISCFLTFHPRPPLVPPLQLKYFFCTLLFNNCRRGIPLLLHWTVAQSQRWTHKVNLLTAATTDSKASTFFSLHPKNAVLQGKVQICF